MPTENTTEVDQTATRKLAEEFLTAYNAADLDRVCSVLTEGAVLMPPNEPVLAGIDLVRPRIESFFNGFTFTMRFDVHQNDVLGDIAFERGAYTAYALLKGEAGELRGGYGEYLLLFERQPDRSWRIAAFGTAAAQGMPPQTIAAPERLEEVVGGTVDPNAYWRDKWVDTLSEHYAYPVPFEIREKLDR
jgi:ketosteroid isomerase-like protein